MGLDFVERLPPGFVERRDGRCRLVVRGELADAVGRLDLSRPQAWTRLAERFPGPPGRAATALLPLPGRRERLHLRPLRHGGVLAPLTRGVFVGAGRALAELSVTARLSDAGAPVPRPVLALAFRSAGPFVRGAFGSVYEEDGADLGAFLAAQPEPVRLARAIRAAGLAVRRLHENGARHPDLHVGNLLLRERDGGCDALVTDLDGARLGASPRPPGAWRS